MKTENTRAAVCPLCGETYTGAPALSREDNQTPICPDCGARQALRALGVKEEEVEEILRIIHRSMEGGKRDD